MFYFLNSSIGKKCVMAISGAFLSIFIVIHSLGNATAYWGRKAYNAYASHLHDLGILLNFMEVVLAVMFCLHIFFGLRLFFENNQAKGKKTSVGKRSFSLLLTRSMPYTGSIVAIFIGYHYFQLHSGPSTVDTAQRVRGILTVLPSALYYMLAIGSLFLHIGHGFWSMFQTLGISHQKYELFVEKACFGVAVIIALVLVFLPLTGLISNTFLL